MKQECYRPTMRLLVSTLIWMLPIYGARGAEPAETGATQPGAGESAPTTESNDAEIVVTALRRSTSVQQTPLAISAISEQTLTNMGITSTEQLARSTPDLVFRESANGGSRIIIRNIQAAGEPTVGLYYDETPVIGSVGVTNDAGGSTPALRTFDIQRVEVLRGPQGTLYGSSSEAGTVRLIFNKPNLARMEAAVDGQAVTVDKGSWGNLEQGMVNLPVVTDTLGVRIVGFHQHGGGWLENSHLGLTNFNDSDSSGGRFMARYKALDSLTVDVMAVIQNFSGWNNNWNGQSYLLQGGPPFDQRLASLQPQQDRLRLYSSTLNWDLGFASLTAVGSYSERTLDFSFDYSPYFSNASANATVNSTGCKVYASTGGAACSTDQLTAYKAFALSLSPITAYQPQRTRNITQEVRLSSTGDTALKWTVGAYGSQRDAQVLSQLNRVDPGTGRMFTPQVPSYQRTVADILDQYAGFAEVTYELFKKLDLTAGVRYFDYKKATTGAVQAGNPVLNVTVSPATTARDSEAGTVSKLNVDYKWTDDLMTFASASQGFRPGGVNQVIGLPTALGPYKSDKLWDYELGIKSSWLARSLVINAGLFQINWSNIQSSAQTGSNQANGSTFSFITNAGNVRVRGIELETTYRPLDRLVLQASGSFAAARLQGDETAPAGITITGAGVDGDYVPYTPKVTAQASAQYTFPVPGQLEVLARADINYIGDSWTVFHRTNAYLQELPGYATEGLRTGLQSSDDKWGVYLFVDNLTNKIGFVTKGNGSSVGSGNALNILATTPRTLGVDGRYRF